MQEDRLITIAIHTYEKAHELKNILKCEGVKVTLQNVNLSTPVVSSGIRVRIRECDLPLALRVIENIEIFAPAALKECADGSAEILVPIDFSNSSKQACFIAFRIASAHKAKIKLLHTYVDPMLTNTASLQLTDAMTFDTSADAVMEIREEKELNKLGNSQMKEFETLLRDKMKDGVIPPVIFSSEVSEGLPEEVITDYASTHHPMLIVMGTRGANRQSRDMLGSVTAEVRTHAAQAYSLCPNLRGSRLWPISAKWFTLRLPVSKTFSLLMPSTGFSRNNRCLSPSLLYPQRKAQRRCGGSRQSERILCKKLSSLYIQSPPIVTVKRD